MYYKTCDVSFIIPQLDFVTFVTHICFSIPCVFDSHPSQKIISNIELVWKKSYLQEIIWPDFTAVLWMDLANAQAV